jgi:hypothetical protein
MPEQMQIIENPSNLIGQAAPSVSARLWRLS